MATSLTKTEIISAKSLKQNYALANFRPAGDIQTDTSITSATDITVTDTAATHVMIQNTDATVTLRYVFDGSTTPTTSVGFILEPGDYVIIPIVDGVTPQVISAAGGEVAWQGLV